jgi:hypothetical protein
MALAEYTFASTFPGSPRSRCGYTTNFTPHTFSTEGVDPVPRLLIGAYSVTLTDLAEDFRDGCQGEIQVTATRTVTGVPGLGTLTHSSSSAVDYLYSVAFAGIENLYLLTTVQTIDFAGLVGESQPFWLWGRINSPLEILEATPTDSPFSPPIYGTTPEELAAIQPHLVPEPHTGALLALVIGLAVVAQRKASRAAAVH